MRKNLPFWRKQKMQPTQTAFVSEHHQSRRRKPLSFVAVLITLGLGMVLWGIGALHTAYVEGQANTPKTQQKNAAADTDPAGCKEAKAEAGQLFATCPSFIQDYTKQKNGTVNSNVFNVTNGEPEANQEAQFYTNDTKNVRIQDGKLILQALNEAKQGYDYTSARIDTKGKKDFLYGKLVVRATLPTGVGTWPAIWMLPSQSKYAALKPETDTTRYLNDGEIDIAESIGTEPHNVYGIAHSLAYAQNSTDKSYFNIINVPDSDTAFHDYELNWTPTNLTYKVDGKEFFSISKQAGADYRSWPYDQPFYLVLNLALGGSWGGTDKLHFPKDGVDKSALPAALTVQSINYYPYIGK